VVLGNNVRVYHRVDGEFLEQKPGAFRITRLGPSAIVAAIDSSPRAPVGEGWIESWTFSLTQKAEHRLSVLFARQVNNSHLPRDAHLSSFSSVLTGEMQKVFPDHV
jgi:hypothetical protein